MKDFLEKIKNKTIFRFSYRRLIVAILVVIFLVGIGMLVYQMKSYYETADGIKKMYQKEIASILGVEEENIIHILKEDLNQDEIEDFIILIGTPKYHNSEDNLGTLDARIESYQDVKVIFISGIDHQAKTTYESKKDFAKDVSLTLYKEEKAKKFLVKDTSTGNALVLELVNNKWRDLIASSFGTNFKGYTFTKTVDSENLNKIYISLDNYGKPYLEKQNEKFVLDFMDKNIDLAKYRQSYSIDLFSDFELVDIDGNGQYELIANQNIFYLYKEDDMPNTIGTISITFTYQDGKFIYQKVEVKI